MKRAATAVAALMAVLLLAACQGHERDSITGSFGSGVVTGQVVMTEGATPSGVEVSVVGTGMTMQIGADGEFAFAGVPENAQLAFRRSSDGINATLQLAQANDRLIVELSQNTATTAKKGRRRSAGVRTVEFEGLVRSASATEVVLDTARQAGVTIAVTPQTLIRHGGTTLTVADLTPGTRVHIKATQAGEVFTAVSIVVQNDEDDDDLPSAREYEGTVISSSATELVILDSHRQQVTFAIDIATVIRKGNTPVLATDIQAGWRVHVKSTSTDDGATNTARLVIVQRTSGDDDGGDDDDAAEAKVSGAVTAVSATGLTVQSGATSVSVTTDAATKIKKRGSTIALADIHVGDQVKVEGTRNADGSVLAKSIEVKK